MGLVVWLKMVKIKCPRIVWPRLEKHDGKDRDRKSDDITLFREQISNNIHWWIACICLFKDNLLILSIVGFVTITSSLGGFNQMVFPQNVKQVLEVPETSNIHL